jgi:3-oxoacyl-[acyl-carrier protein] reductase
MTISEQPVALVTGASRGIGRAVAERLAHDGFMVLINYFQNRDAAEEVERTIASAGGACLTCPFDVGDKDSVWTSVKRLSREVGRIEVLVNNAATIRDQPLVRMHDEDWDAVLRVNLSGVYYCTKSILRTWAGGKPGSRIINMSSVSGEMGNAYQVNYAATKGGVIGFTKALARELAPKGVTVNAIAPGFIETDATREIPREEILGRIPLGRFGQPRDVAHVVSMLASPLAGYITGQVFRVDGGLNM